VIEKYSNLPFMPCKNEEIDKRDIIMRSKELNPVISFPVVVNNNSVKMKRKSGV
jgi:hypothetical protein